MLERCSEVATDKGLVEAWKPFLPHVTSVLNSMVQEGIPRTNAESFAAAMAIVHSRRIS